MTSLALSLIVLVDLVITVKAADFDKYSALSGIKVDGNWRTVFGVEKDYTCCLECENNTNCTAVNYNKSEQACELIHGSSNEKLWYTFSSGWNTYVQRLKDVNVLSTAVTTQSSYYANDESFSKRAIDGDTNGIWDAGSCSHTLDTGDMWWMVDFQNNFPVSAVIIWNRVDVTNWRRLQGITVSVGRSQSALKDIYMYNVCGTYEGPPTSGSDNPIRIDCNHEMYGRFLKIEKDKPGTDALNFCEVEVIQ